MLRLPHCKEAQIAAVNVRRVITPVHVVFCRCRVESKSGRIRQVKRRQIALAILAALSASTSVVRTAKPINGKEKQKSRQRPDEG